MPSGVQRIMNSAVTIHASKSITDKDLERVSEKVKKIGHTKPYQFTPTLHPRDPEHKEDEDERS